MQIAIDFNSKYYDRVVINDIFSQKGCEEYNSLEESVSEDCFRRATYNSTDLAKQLADDVREVSLLEDTVDFGISINGTSKVLLRCTNHLPSYETILAYCKLPEEFREYIATVCAVYYKCSPEGLQEIVVPLEELVNGLKV